MLTEAATLTGRYIFANRRGLLARDETPARPAFAEHYRRIALITP